MTIDDERRIYLPGGAWAVGFWRRPAGPTNGVVVHCPGWSGTADSDRYRRWHDALTGAGIAVFAFDFPGKGRAADSVPLATLELQQEALRAAVHLVAAETGLSAGIGLLGSGATGASHVIEVAASLSQVDAIVSQFPIATGAGWLSHLLSAPQRIALDEVIARDRAARVSGGVGGYVDFTALRDGTSADVAVAERPEPGWVAVELLESLLRFDPVGHVGRVRAPVLLLAVRDDRVTPEANARAFAEALAGPVRMVTHRDVAHYEAYTSKAHVIEGEMVSWFTAHLSVEADVEEAVGGLANGRGRAAG